jgi:hypothetical protein
MVLFNLNNCLNLYIKHILIKQNTISSLELVSKLTFSERARGNRTELEHKNILVIIRDEFEEIGLAGKFSRV